MTNNRVTCIYGSTGSGKSTLAKALLKGRPKVVVFDPMGEYRGRGWTVCRDIAGARRAMVAQWSKSAIRVSLSCPEGDEKTAAALANLCWQAQANFPRDPRPLTLVLEEANLAYPNRQNLPPGLKRATLQGRHRGINLLVITQRPALVSTDLRGQATQINVFQLPGPHDRKAVESACAGIGDALAALKRFQFLKVEGVQFSQHRTLKNGIIR